MLLAVQPATIGIISSLFGFEVPGHQIWTPRSFYAVAQRDVGGAPDRSYLLTISDGTNTVVSVGADDAGDEPGTCSITWAHTPATSVASGAVGVSVAPLGPIVLPSGYQVLGSIVNGAPGDGWLSATAWYDYVYTTPPGRF